MSQSSSLIRRWLVVGALVLALGSAVAAPVREMLVLVTLSGVSFNDFAAWDLPVYRQLIGRGGLALLNNRSAGSLESENSAMTLNAGTRAFGFELPAEGARDAAAFRYARMAYNTEEWVEGMAAAAVLERNTGTRAPLTALVHLGLPPLERINASLRYPVHPGLLGQQLQGAGVITGAFGNADCGTQRHRAAALIAMNAQGWADFGDVGWRTLVADTGRPYAGRTNFAFIRQELAQLPAGRYFAVVDAGDLARLESVAPFMAPARYAALRRACAEECGQFITDLDAALREGGTRYRILLAAITPTPDARSSDLLSPVLLLGSEVREGLLRSPSTRRAGLVLNVDLTASILAFFGVPPHPSMRGKPVDVVPARDALATLTAMNGQITATYAARTPVIKGYIIVLACGILLSLGMVLLGPRARGVRVLAWTPLLRPLLIAIMLGPVTFLLAGGLGMHGTPRSSLFVAVVALVAAAALHRGVRDLRLIFAVVGCVTAAALCLDVLAGVPLLRQSLFSYDPIAGIRFYGLGNESSGAVIGTALLGLFALLDYLRPGRWGLAAVGLIGLGITALIGAPMLGADFGGILAALVGFGVALLKARGPMTRRALIGAALVVAVMLAGLLAYNVGLAPDRQSHVGRAFVQAHEQGAQVLLQTATRKWAMNLRLVHSSWWAFALGSLLAGVIVLRYRPAGILRRVLTPHPLLNAGFAGNLAAVLVALCTNDSGVVMAAVGMLYLAAPILLLVQAEREASSPSPAGPPPGAADLAPEH